MRSADPERRRVGGNSFGAADCNTGSRPLPSRVLPMAMNGWTPQLTWLDSGAERTAAILSIVATCIAHDVNPRAYLHIVTKLIVNGWPQKMLRELLPDRVLSAHPELYVGERYALPASSGSPAMALGP